jgi:hypothetical protein
MLKRAILEDSPQYTRHVMREPGFVSRYRSLSLTESVEFGFLTLMVALFAWGAVSFGFMMYSFLGAILG